MEQLAVERVENRYEIRVGGELAGFTEFRDHDDQRVFFHTEIAEVFQGKGLSSVLIERALTRTREDGNASFRYARRWPATSRTTDSPTSPTRYGTTS